MAYHHFCVTLSSLSLSLAFLLHFSPTIYSNAEDLFQDETRQFKPHPRHHRYHSSLITNRPYHNQEDTQVAYLPILIILIVISLFLIVNCYKKESSPHIPDLTETSCLSAFISRACNSNEVTGHHSFLLPKVKTINKTIHPPTSLILSPLINNNNNKTNSTTISIEDNSNQLQSDSLRSSNINHVNDDDDEYRYYQQHQQQPVRYYHQRENIHHYHNQQFYQYQQCPNSDHHNVNCSSGLLLSSSSSSTTTTTTTILPKSIITVTSNPIVSLLSSPCSTPPLPPLQEPPPPSLNKQITTKLNFML